MSSWHKMSTSVDIVDFWWQTDNNYEIWIVKCACLVAGAPNLNLFEGEIGFASNFYQTKETKIYA